MHSIDGILTSVPDGLFALAVSLFARGTCAEAPLRLSSIFANANLWLGTGTARIAVVVPPNT